MADWNFNGRSGHPEELEYPPNHRSDGLDDPLSSIASPQPSEALQRSITSLPASNLSHPVYDGSGYTNFGFQLEQPEYQQMQQALDTSTSPNVDTLSYDRNSYLRGLIGGHSQHQPGFVAPNMMSHLQNPTSGGYPTLPQSQLEVYTGGSALQQAPATHLLHGPGSFSLGQNAPQEPSVFTTSLNPQAAASAHGYRNSQHAAGSSQYQPEAFDTGSASNAAAYPNDHTLHSQNPAGGSYPILPQSGLSQPGVMSHNTFQSRDPAGGSYPLPPQSQLNQPNVIAPINFQSQDPGSGSYPTLGSQLQGSTVTDSASQQVVVNRLHHDSFNPVAASAYGSRDSQASSQYQPEAFDINSVPSVTAYPNYPTLPFQGPAGGSHPTSGSHLAQASSITDSVSQQVAANRSHHDSFSPAAASAYGSRSSQHAPGSQYQQPDAFKIRSAPNEAAYPNPQTSHSQGSLFLQLGPQSSTISAVQQSSMSRDIDGSIPQNAPQRLALLQTALANPTSSMSDAAPQSSSSALGAHCLDAASALDSEDFFSRLGSQRLTSRKPARTLSKGVPFLRSNSSLPSARSQSTEWISMLQVDNHTLELVKYAFLHLSFI
ncbi:hypothetical protein EDD22DRAFT_960428 [Suillus occidentalis]|nr:hypothetical protein EDD22DRAFT_960428 [Suillus occidentalis]